MPYGQYFGTTLTDLQAASTAADQLDEARRARQAQLTFAALSQGAKQTADARESEANRALKYFQTNQETGLRNRGYDIEADRNQVLREQIKSQSELSKYLEAQRYLGDMARLESNEKIAGMGLEGTKYQADALKERYGQMDPRVAEETVRSNAAIDARNKEAEGTAAAMNASLNALDSQLNTELLDTEHKVKSFFTHPLTWQSDLTKAKDAVKVKWDQGVADTIAKFGPSASQVKYNPATRRFEPIRQDLLAYGSRTATRPSLNFFTPSAQAAPNGAFSPALHFAPEPSLTQSPTLTPVNAGPTTADMVRNLNYSSAPPSATPQPYDLVKAAIQKEASSLPPGGGVSLGFNMRPVYNAWTEFLARKIGYQPRRIGSSTLGWSAGSAMAADPVARAQLDQIPQDQINDWAGEFLLQAQSTQPSSSWRWAPPITALK